MKHIIIGTAGHVDHGKTVLVKALTGTDTDRLKEEKERGISIELGFAYLKLPGGLNAGIIDVPGHERFIKNMLAGVGGIDLVLLVIAADEGIMPQTREHLEIIQLLQVARGAVVLTKKDLVDQEWLDMVQEEVDEFLQGTVLGNAPVLAVSAVTGEGMDELVQVIDQLTVGAEKRKFAGPPRLPVDRVFTVTGFGTVATGTLLSGALHVGENLQLFPGERVSRVRTLQVHGLKVETAQAGQRVAVNLTGVDTDSVNRGDVLAPPGSLRPTHRLDVKLQLLDSAPKELKHRARVRVYLGTAEILGRVILLDREELQPGSEAYIQLQLETPVAVAKSDHFVIRSYSPMRTVGGGLVVDPAPARHRRNRPEVLEALATAEKGTPAELAGQQLETGDRLYTNAEVAAGTGMDKETVTAALAELVASGQASLINSEGELYYLAAGIMSRWQQTIRQALEEYHRKFPLREGYPREELRSRFFAKLNSKQFNLLLSHLEQAGQLSGTSQSVSVKDFKPQPTPGQQEMINRLVESFVGQMYQPPAWEEAAQGAGLKGDNQEYLNYLLARNVLVKIADGMYFHHRAIEQAVSAIREHLAKHNELSLGEMRDLLQTSRKYTLPLLEYMDRIKITRRVGDTRVAGRAL
ncbi:MAG TPA: selenocysteine-specific translation elongation factor [Desulfotomaculum sp.]|nr:MAG: translation elongation factor [Desulfotomaculum sp. BICA1-6]HBX22036.1 selenocysteine-specific translation elongation factor [Desulfotomaculum sp.]